jgi:plasmid stability protein
MAMIATLDVMGRRYDSTTAINAEHACMAQILIRNVDDAVVAALRARAATRGVSLEAELRDVLARSAGHPRADLAAEFAATRALTPAKPHRLAEDLVRESRTER